MHSMKERRYYSIYKKDNKMEDLGNKNKNKIHFISVSLMNCLSVIMFIILYIISLHIFFYKTNSFHLSLREPVPYANRTYNRILYSTEKKKVNRREQIRTQREPQKSNYKASMKNYLKCVKSAPYIDDAKYGALISEEEEREMKMIKKMELEELEKRDELMEKRRLRRIERMKKKEEEKRIKEEEERIKEEEKRIKEEEERIKEEEKRLKEEEERRLKEEEKERLKMLEEDKLYKEREEQKKNKLNVEKEVVTFERLKSKKMDEKEDTVVEKKENVEDQKDTEEVREEASEDKGDIEEVGKEEASEDKEDTEEVKEQEEASEDKEDTEEVKEEEASEDKGDIEEVEKEETSEDKGDTEEVREDEVSEDIEDSDEVGEGEVSEDIEDSEEVGKEEEPYEKGDYEEKYKIKEKTYIFIYYYLNNIYYYYYNIFILESIGWTYENVSNIFLEEKANSGINKKDIYLKEANERIIRNSIVLRQCKSRKEEASDDKGYSEEVGKEEGSYDKGDAEEVEDEDEEHIRSKEEVKEPEIGTDIEEENKEKYIKKLDVQDTLYEINVLNGEDITSFLENKNKIIQNEGEEDDDDDEDDEDDEDGEDGKGVYINIVNNVPGNIWNDTIYDDNYNNNTYSSAEEYIFYEKKLDDNTRNNMKRSYYDILDVKEDSDINEIKRKFYNLSLKYYPKMNKDKNLVMNQKFENISEAYQILGYENRRKLYDLGEYDETNKMIIIDPLIFFNLIFTSDMMYKYTGNTQVSTFVKLFFEKNISVEDISYYVGEIMKEMMEGQNIREEKVAELLKDRLDLYIDNEDEFV
ncbi:hypothetical protein PFNF135_00140 [Plasmodium falciparum NF135/5.C10]|uniref:J domain-containing protein n=1 Tax=Plasmodium falciparum NF135/5.C10 TaxID=1036726 RepID=W4IR86_PLAFA|nr:hypothetical protein PFNF135_00140 [Plasmodium falciparum NF135/5.C10]